ncbi:MAG: hypothetical protein ABI678_10245 [Kofleriaceae bacterium]
MRLRYFYGKRLNVSDFVDEQRYHSGKMRFHNQHLHGAGVLCGLAVGLYSPGETVIRVTKGAALDSCGREIIVGYDQCVDVAAWYAKYRADQLAHDPAWTPVLDAGLLRLCVVIRFRECTSGPEPAPRDPCACDATGTDYGRVREEFELALQLHDDALAHSPPPLAPARAKLDPAAGGALGGADLAAKVRDLLMVGCPGPDHDDGWLVLSCFGVELDATGAKVVAVDELGAQATMLYSSALLEDLMMRELGATLEAGALASNGPEVAALSFTPGPNDQLNVGLSGAIVGPTAIAAAFELRRLDPATGWQAPGGAPVVAYVTTPPTLQVSVAAGFFAADQLYRLAIISDEATPIVDDQLRPLKPLRPSFHFKIVDDGGTLALRPAPYAEVAP